MVAAPLLRRELLAKSGDTSALSADWQICNTRVVPELEPEEEYPRREDKNPDTASQCPSRTIPIEKNQKKECVPDVSLMAAKASVHRMERYGRKLHLRGRDLETATELVKEYGPDEVADAYRNYIDNDSSFLCDKKHPWGIFANQFEDYDTGEDSVLRQQELKVMTNNADSVQALRVAYSTA
jgi:hypothetical protein